MAATTSRETLLAMTDEQRAIALFVPFCSYCFATHEPFFKCKGHAKSSETGEISCPKLRLLSPQTSCTKENQGKDSPGTKSSCQISLTVPIEYSETRIFHRPLSPKSYQSKKAVTADKSLRVEVLNRLFLSRLEDEHRKQECNGTLANVPQIPDPRILRRNRDRIRQRNVVAAKSRVVGKKESTTY